MGKENGMTSRVLAGLAAGAAGTTALNAVTYLDMALSARPASSTPEDTVGKAEDAVGMSLSSWGPDSEAASNRRSGNGALGCSTLNWPTVLSSCPRE